MSMSSAPLPKSRQKNSNRDGRDGSKTVLVGDVNQRFAHVASTNASKSDGRMAPVQTIAVSAIAPRLHQTTLSFRDKLISHDNQIIDRSTAHPPPAKRRKLAASNHGQTTLDKHFFSNTTSHTTSQPHTPSIPTVTPAQANTFETVSHVRPAATSGNTDNASLKSAAQAVARASSRLSRSPAPAVATPPPQQYQRRTSTGKSEDKRTLRSQDEGPRLKSELATYFPNYEEIIFDAPKEDELITVDSVLYITEDAPRPNGLDAVSPNKGGRGSKLASKRNALHIGTIPPLTPQRTSWTSYNGSPSLDMDFMLRSAPDNPEDPLSDAHFMKSHRRIERRERQLRNIERERAMHEKVQLDRLLDGLQGHDWLRVLGITGITDGEARRFEPKRDYFIAEVRALVDKFKQFKEEEKRQRLEKEAAAQREAEASDDDADEDDDASDADTGDESPDGSTNPPSSDLNASASRQLQQDVLRASKTPTHKSFLAKARAGQRISNAFSIDTPTASRSMQHSRLPPPILPPPSPEIPITSFYAKRHLRDAALGKSRHGRSVTAFGLPLPDMDEADFELPEDYITEDMLRANARERRRRKREAVGNAGG